MGKKDELESLSVTVTRRQVLQGSGALAATCLIGCSGTVIDGAPQGGDSGGDPDPGAGDGQAGDPIAGDVQAGGDPMAGDERVGDAQAGDSANSAPVWQTIPDQAWVVGVPVLIDLADYCDDPDGDPLTYELDQALPPGVTLNGSVISGTPSAVFAATDFVATADDGN